ncbi:hypothetical protein DMC64_42415 [Amycolatopsis sp. WAC 04197]|uniref:hypothetical protein n=1 Tax=Amycolatopsis sp. WAC 04197 TaxID=2203199 RepID=UPI000F78FA63|nr:hypothetical protein [Amycolatopsis sp. WAC 04197]RSN38412.1 hypothetical protein DMC64_42415 [Amycolatopsis sp. WAC 04197]
MKPRFKFAGSVSIAFAALVTVAGLAAPPASAANGTLTLCSRGDYSSYVTFVARGSATAAVDPGHCADFAGFTGDDAEPIEVYGISGSAAFRVAEGEYRGRLGGTVVTYGTPGNVWATTPSVR